jgi:hypothetical protein
MKTTEASDIYLNLLSSPLAGEHEHSTIQKPMYVKEMIV